MSIIHEFSRPLPVEGIVPDKIRNESVAATEAECAALAKRFDLRSLSGLKGVMTVLRVSEGNIIRVAGTIEAEVVQTCVVSLQGVSGQVRTQFDTYFTEDRKEGPDTECDPDQEEEMSDVMGDGILDLGELTAQYLSLALEPYPRAPGVSLAAQLAEIGMNSKNRPFQVLQALKTTKEE